MACFDTYILEYLSLCCVVTKHMILPWYRVDVEKEVICNKLLGLGL